MLVMRMNSSAKVFAHFFFHLLRSRRLVHADDFALLPVQE